MLLVDDIDDYTLRHVLQHLSLTELCDCALTNNHLRQAARSEFVHHYQRKRIHLVLATTHFEFNKEYEVEIYGTRYILLILRIFGDLIRNLSIDLSCFVSHDRLFIFSYIARYAKFLEIFRFCNAHCDSLKGFECVFPNLDRVEFFGCVFNHDFFLNRLSFPRLSTVDFYGWNSVSFMSVSSSRHDVDVNETNIAGIRYYVYLNPEINIRFFE